MRKNKSHKPPPALKIVSGPSPASEAMAQATLSGLLAFGSAFSQAVDLMPHEDTDLHHFLKFRRAIAVQASKRGHWFLGRLYNKMAGEDADYVSLSGVHLRQTLSACGIETPNFIVADGEYMLRMDYVENALDILNRKISKNI